MANEFLWLAFQHHQSKSVTDQKLSGGGHLKGVNRKTSDQVGHGCWFTWSLPIREWCTPSNCFLPSSCVIPSNCVIPSPIERGTANDGKRLIIKAGPMARLPPACPARNPASRGGNPASRGGNIVLRDLLESPPQKNTIGANPHADPGTYFPRRTDR
jgi:hypothetical protein